MNNKTNITYLLSFLLIVILSSCGTKKQKPDAEDYLVKMDTILNDLTDEETGRIKPEMAQTYIGMIDKFVTTYPTSPESPKLLYKAAEVARSIQDFNKALTTYAKIEADYPAFAKSSKALFMQAFTYAEDLGNDEKARELYEAFIAKYPEDDFVDDAKILLETMGKTDEEIFESLGK